MAPQLGAGATLPRPPHLRAQWAVAFEEVSADLCFPGHVDMAVGTVTVVANPLQEVGADRHLGGRQDVRASGPLQFLRVLWVVLLHLAPESPHQV